MAVQKMQPFCSNFCAFNSQTKMKHSYCLTSLTNEVKVHKANTSITDAQIDALFSSY